MYVILDKAQPAISVCFYYQRKRAKNMKLKSYSVTHSLIKAYILGYVNISQTGVQIFINNSDSSAMRVRLDEVIL